MLLQTAGSVDPALSSQTAAIRLLSSSCGSILSSFSPTPSLRNGSNVSHALHLTTIELRRRSTGYLSATPSAVLCTCWQHCMVYLTRTCQLSQRSDKPYLICRRLLVVSRTTTPGPSVATLGRCLPVAAASVKVRRTYTMHCAVCSTAARECGTCYLYGSQLAGVDALACHSRLKSAKVITDKHRYTSVHSTV